MIRIQFNKWPRKGSENTKRQYRIYLQRFLEYTNSTSSQITNWSMDDIEYHMEDFTDHLLSRKGKLDNEGNSTGEPCSGNTVRLAWAAIKRWYYDQGIYIRRKLRGVSKVAQYLDYIPTKSDLNEVLDTVSLKYRVFISLMAFSGLRIRDAQELQYEDIKTSFEADDEILTIIYQPTKTKEWYFTLLGPQGLSYLRQLLYQRKNDGEIIHDKSYIVSGDGSRLSRSGIKKYHKRRIRPIIGHYPETHRRFRLYNFRKYFKRQTSAIGRDESEYLMGHKSGRTNLAAVYSGLSDLDPIAINDLKEKYVENLPNLESQFDDKTLGSVVDSLRDENKELRIQLDQLPQLIDDAIKSRFVEFDKEQDAFNKLISVLQDRYPEALRDTGLEERR